MSFAEAQVTIQIPASAVGTSGLRKLSTVWELDETLKILRGRCCISKMIWSRRSEDCRLKISRAALMHLPAS